MRHMPGPCANILHVCIRDACGDAPTTTSTIFLARMHIDSAALYLTLYTRRCWRACRSRRRRDTIRTKVQRTRALAPRPTRPGLVHLACRSTRWSTSLCASASCMTACRRACRPRRPDDAPVGAAARGDGDQRHAAASGDGRRPSPSPELLRGRLHL